jgi:hypothetical protein
MQPLGSIGVGIFMLSSKVSNFVRRFRIYWVLAGVGLVVGIAGLAVPRISSGPSLESRERGIRHNLRILDQVKNQWAAETRSSIGALPTEADLGPYLNGGKLPEPLWGERYEIRAFGELPTATLGNRRIK